MSKEKMIRIKTCGKCPMKAREMIGGKLKNICRGTGIVIDLKEMNEKCPLEDVKE